MLETVLANDSCAVLRRGGSSGLGPEQVAQSRNASAPSHSHENSKAIPQGHVRSVLRMVSGTQQALTTSLLQLPNPRQ